MKTVFVLLALFALSGCEVTPPSPRASYPIDTDQPVYTGPQEYRPESYPDPEYPFYPTTQSRLPGLQPIPQSWRLTLQARPRQRSPRINESVGA